MMTDAVPITPITRRMGTFRLPAPWLELRYFEALDSAHRHVRRLISAGEDLRGIVFWAETQGMDANRPERGWGLNEGGLNIVAVLPTKRPFNEYWLPWLSLLGAMNFVRLLDEIFNIKAQIKWPNEVVIDGKVVASFNGELLCGSHCGDFPWRQTLIAMKANWLNNVDPAQTPAEFPATRVADHAAGVTSEGRRAFLMSWLSRTREAIRTLCVDADGAGRFVRREVEKDLFQRDQAVAFDETDWGLVGGKLAGLGACGAAKIKLANDNIIEIHSGRQVRAN